MKKLLLLILFFASLKSFGQTIEDSTNYVKYPYSNQQVGKMWPLYVLKLPDTTYSQHAKGNFARNPLGTKVFISNGSSWVDVSGTSGGSTIDTLYSVIVNVDTIYSEVSRTDTLYSVITNTDTLYSIITRSDTIYSNITSSDTIYSIVLRTDTIYNNYTSSDTIYSVTSRTDTLIVNNNLVIPIRDTADYPDPVQGNILFAPSDNNYYGYNGTYWVCFSCAGNGTCYRDILIDTSHFSDANTCIDAAIVGSIYAIYWNDLPGFIYEGTDYSLNGTGFDIDIAGFDATANAYQFHVYTIDTTGSCDNAVVITGGGGGGTTYSFTNPLQESSGVVTIDNAGADGATKGAASFATNDFNSAAGNISLDYTNGQKATSSLPGFMTAADKSILDRLNLRNTIQTLTPANTVTINVNSGFKATLLLNRATTTIAFSNVTSGDEGLIRLTQDGTGGRLIEVPVNSIIPLAIGGSGTINLSTAGGDVDDLYWWYDGTNYHFSLAKNLQ